MTKDYSLKKCGEVEAGMLAAEWCRQMWYWDLWCSHGSWEAAGGVRAFDEYRETEGYSMWLDARPAGEARTEGMELLKLRPNL